MNDFNYYHIVAKNNDEFDIHCSCISITGYGYIELTQIWNDLTVSFKAQDICFMSQINPLDAGMEFTCYNDLVRAFSEHAIDYEVMI